MERAPFLQQVICRPALERDLGEIKEFCKTIWDGHDYIADVIDDWFYDPRPGLFAVAEYEGRAIACSKITGLAEGQWWLEGFRVDPAYQGRGVGSLLHHYVHQWWHEHGNGALRLMTSSQNRAVHHLCEDTGFQKMFEIRGYKAQPLEESVDTFDSAASGEQGLDPIIEFMRRSPSLSLTSCVVDFGWRFADPTQDRALGFLFYLYSDFGNHFFWWRDRQGLLIVWDDFDPNDEEFTMGIGVLACQLDDLYGFLMDVRRLAAKQKRTSVFWLAPVHERIEQALEQAGYSSDWENTAYIFEKKHPEKR